MKHSRSLLLAGPVLAALMALACGIAGRSAGAWAGERAPAAGGAAAGTSEIIYFGGRRGASVRLVRGVVPATVVPATIVPATIAPATAAPAAGPQTRQIVSFGTGRAEQVTIVRGLAGPPPLRQAALAPGTRVEQISFAEQPHAPVMVVRGGVLRQAVSLDLFGPAGEGELERVTFAVDGVESRHGADSRMWRPEPQGPQGPMQVSAAAALDVGGGDRFDPRQNRLLGRAYLAQMFRRYGNWADALAGYNWGPGNVDQWIAAGRPTERLPLETARYIDKVLRDALIATAAVRL